MAPADSDIPAIPRHVAIIMDGNGRWARRRGYPRIRGHQAGAKTVREITQECARLGVGQLTLYAFSVENWKRPGAEVRFLMTLYRRHLIRERKTIMDNNIRFRMIGDPEPLPPGVRRELATTGETSAANTGMTLCLAVNYGGRGDIVRAARELARRAVNGEIRPADIDEKAFAAALSTAGMPEPDLLIRTAGEMRISNFLLWEVSYAELWVTDVLWPDFRKSHLHEALRDYAKRDRRYGGLGES
ncbi:MAG: isoprenyl transferase [Planctomycetota bacterium]